MRNVYTTGFRPFLASFPGCAPFLGDCAPAMGEATPEQVARQFKRGRAASVKPLLESLSALGQARLIEGGRFAA